MLTGGGRVPCASGRGGVHAGRRRGALRRWPHGHPYVCAGAVAGTRGRSGREGRGRAPVSPFGASRGSHRACTCVALRARRVCCTLPHACGKQLCMASACAPSLAAPPSMRPHRRSSTRWFRSRKAPWCVVLPAACVCEPNARVRLPLTSVSPVHLHVTGGSPG